MKILVESGSMAQLLYTIPYERIVTEINRCFGYHSVATVKILNYIHEAYLAAIVTEPVYLQATTKTKGRPS